MDKCMLNIGWFKRLEKCKWRKILFLLGIKILFSKIKIPLSDNWGISVFKCAKIKILKRRRKSHGGEPVNILTGIKPHHSWRSVNEKRKESMSN